MLNRKEKILWLLYAAVLVILFLASSTDLIIKERKQEIYQISVIIEESSDKNYTNFRKGMEQAALEFHADVSFIALYESNNQKQQLERILRERQDGAGALIVSPVDDLALVQVISDENIALPFVFINTKMTGEAISASVSPDYTKMGKQLAEELKKRHEQTTPVYLFGGKKRNRIARLFEAGIREELEQAGYEVRLFEKQEEGEYRSAIEALVYPSSEHGVIVALDQSALLEAASVLADSSVYASYVDGLYGRGTSLEILNTLDLGLVRGICVTDDFTQGYRSVQMAVELITKQSAGKEIWQDSYYIEKEDLYTSAFEKMLYPIE